MNHRERMVLISRIGRQLQSTMTTTDINTYMSTFKVKTPNLPMADSKWVYVKEILGPVDESVIIRIAKDLGLYNLSEVVPGSAQLINQLDQSSMQVCRDDFEKALKDVETDPPNAIGMASTTLESICKAILDAFKVSYLSNLVKSYPSNFNKVS